MPNESKSFFVKLSNRGLIHVEGDDRVAFLQNLISNDVSLLEEQPIIYSCLLTPQGKFLFDFFIIKGDGFLLIDCEGGERAQDLYKRLNMYRLRSKVKISLEESHTVYAGIGDLPENAINDPRHEALGWRSFIKPEGNESEYEIWDQHRIICGIPDGSKDMAIESSTLLENNIDTLNGVSFDKGCYIGQEVTARMKYRGLTKKRLYPVKFSAPIPSPNSDVHLNGKKIGQVRSVCKNLGMVLLKSDALENKDLPFEVLNI